MKKAISMTLFALFAALLIGGGIYRTSAKEGYNISFGGEEIVQITQDPQVSQARAEREGRGQGNLNEELLESGERQGQGLGNGGQPLGRSQKSDDFEGYLGGQGQGQGQGSGYQSQPGVEGQGYRGGQGQGQGQGRGFEDQPGAEDFEGYQGGGGRGGSYEVQEVESITGTVVQAPAYGVDMIVDAGGQEILVGTGPGWLDEQGFTIEAGDNVVMQGFWEDGEFKPQSIEIDGSSIVLRDEYGRPVWSGAGRLANGASGGNFGQGGGQGLGRQARDGSGLSSDI